MNIACNPVQHNRTKHIDTLHQKKSLQRFGGYNPCPYRSRQVGKDIYSFTNLRGSIANKGLLGYKYPNISIVIRKNIPGIYTFIP